MAKVVLKESADLESILEQLPVELRAKGMGQAVRAGGNEVVKRARQLAPRGNPDHNPEAKPLHKTITQVVRAYKNDQVWVSISGPAKPAGSHGHLVEGGHEVIVSRGDRKGEKPLSGSAHVEGKEFMAPAVDGTMAQQDAAIRAKLSKVASEASK